MALARPLGNIWLNLSPKILVITNIEADHLDYYKDLDDIKSAFEELEEKVPADGFVITENEYKEIIDTKNERQPKSTQ